MKRQRPMIFALQRWMRKTMTDPIGYLKASVDWLIWKSGGKPYFDWSGVFGSAPDAVLWAESTCTHQHECALAGIEDDD